MRTKTYRVGLRGTKIIAGLDLSGTKAELFSWYDMRAKINRWWHGCSVREAPLTLGVNAVAVAVVESWDKTFGIR